MGAFRPPYASKVGSAVALGTKKSTASPTFRKFVKIVSRTLDEKPTSEPQFPKWNPTWLSSITCATLKAPGEVDRPGTRFRLRETQASKARLNDAPPFSPMARREIFRWLRGAGCKRFCRGICLWPLDRGRSHGGKANDD